MNKVMKPSVKVKPQNDWEKENGARTLLVVGRMSYQHLWYPSTYEGALVNHFSASIMLDGAEEEDINLIKRCLLHAVKNNHPDTKYAGIENPKLVEKEGTYSLKLRTNFGKPPVFYTTNTAAAVEATGRYKSLGKSDTVSHTDVVAPVDPETGASASQTLYAGCWVLFNITVSGDKRKPKAWVNLNAVRKMADGEPLGGDRLSAMGSDMGEPVEGAHDMGMGTESKSDDPLAGEFEDFGDDFDDLGTPVEQKSKKPETGGFEDFDDDDDFPF